MRPAPPSDLGTLPDPRASLRSLCLTLALAATLPAPGFGQARDEPSRRGARAVRALERSDSDGVLDEAFWAGIGHAQYFAVLLRDSDPGAIRRSILQREGRIDQDDRFIICHEVADRDREAHVPEGAPGAGREGCAGDARRP